MVGVISVGVIYVGVISVGVISVSGQICGWSYVSGTPGYSQNATEIPYIFKTNILVIYLLLCMSITITRQP